MTLFSLGFLSAALAVPAAADVFDLIDLTYPGLEDVRVRIENGDRAGAGDALLAYYRGRTSPSFPEFPLTDDRAVADAMARNVFTLRNSTRDFGDSVDWAWVDEDKEWQYSLNRMDWLPVFAGAYRATSDERYVHAWMNHVAGWIAGVDHPGFPRTIDTGRRLRNWVISYLAFVQEENAPSVTPDFNQRMLASMVEQAEYLMRPESWRRYSNWGTFETSGLALFTLMFPEFKRSDAWLHEVWFRMHVQMDVSFHDDGMHVEASPSYHAHELEAWYEFLHLAEVNDVESPMRAQIPLPDDRARLRAPAEALMYLLKPNGHLPQIGDTDDESARDDLRSIASFLRSEEMTYVATSGRNGSPPSKRSAAFPDAGYYVMRSGWGEEGRSFDDEQYLLFTTITNRPWHAHFDVLSIVADAYGHELLVDPGRFTYNDESPERAHFKSTAAHNTVVIDGMDQTRFYTPPTSEWHSTAGFDFVAGRYDGHDAVVHDRSVFSLPGEYWIVTDRLSGDGSVHQYDQFWHLPEYALNCVEVDEDTRVITTPHLLIYTPRTDAKIHVEKSSISRHYRERTEAPSLRISTSTERPVVWPTVLYPLADSAPSIHATPLEVRAVAADVRAAALRIEGEHFVDFYLEQVLPGEVIRVGDFETDARLIHARFDPAGQLVSLQMLDGGYVLRNGEELARIIGSRGTVATRSGEVYVDADMPIQVRVHVRGGRSLIVNGEEVETTSDTGVLSYEHPALDHVEAER